MLRPPERGGKYYPCFRGEYLQATTRAHLELLKPQIESIRCWYCTAFGLFLYRHIMVMTSDELPDFLARLDVSTLAAFRFLKHSL